MNFGISNRTALICASSRGLGRACAEALAAEGVSITINGRDPKSLAETLEAIRDTYDVEAQAIQADITTPEGRETLLKACPEADILINNLAGPTPRSLLEATAEHWREGLEASMVSPLLLTTRLLPGMVERRFGRIVNITSAMVTTPRSHQALSSGPRAGLTAVMKGVSFEVAQSNVTINNLLPERIDTDRQRFMVERLSKLESISLEAAREKIVQSIPAKRMGRPEEFGAVCAFFCSEHAGFMTGMNIHLDGGAYPALV